MHLRAERPAPQIGHSCEWCAHRSRWRAGADPIYPLGVPTRPDSRSLPPCIETPSWNSYQHSIQVGPEPMVYALFMVLVLLTLGAVAAGARWRAHVSFHRDRQRHV